MSLAAFIAAVLALLLAPGPTNTLIGLAGAQRGMSRVLRLLPAEVLGYLTTILPLVWLGPDLIARQPALALALKLAAAAWVLFLSIKLWGRQSSDAATTEVTARKIWLTTALNPKALIFGLVLLPPLTDPHLPARLALFCAMIAGVGLIWGTAGVLTQAKGGNAQRVMVLRRSASVWLGMVSVMMVAGALRGARPAGGRHFHSASIKAR